MNGRGPAARCGADHPPEVARYVGSFRCLTLVVSGLLDAEELVLLGAILAEVDEQRRLVLRQVVQARLEDRVLLVADRPRQALRLLVERTVDRRGGISGRVV